MNQREWKKGKEVNEIEAFFVVFSTFAILKLSITYCFMFQGLRQLCTSVYLTEQKCLQLVIINEIRKQRRKTNKTDKREGMERETEDFSYTSQGCV